MEFIDRALYKVVIFCCGVAVGIILYLRARREGGEGVAKQQSGNPAGRMPSAEEGEAKRKAWHHRQDQQCGVERAARSGERENDCEDRDDEHTHGSSGEPRRVHVMC